jgi:hypothetical protein
MAKGKKKKNSKQTAPPDDTVEKTTSPGDTVEKDAVQVLVIVPPRIRDKAKQEAELVHLYGWIPEPTVKSLFVWLIDRYLDAGIKQFMAKRRGEQPVETKNNEDGG